MKRTARSKRIAGIFIHVGVADDNLIHDATYCGSRGDSIDDVFGENGGSLTVLFSTDGDTTSSGFQFSWIPTQCKLSSSVGFQSFVVADKLLVFSFFFFRFLLGFACVS